MKLTKYEQETIINFNNDEQEASSFASSTSGSVSNNSFPTKITPCPEMGKRKQLS